MSKYQPEFIDQQFYRGKRLLDCGYYDEAINIFNELIKISQEEKDNPDAKVTLETSLNNRGVAFCKLALIKKDKEMYLKGMDDFKNSFSSAKTEEERIWLTSYGNFKFAEKEINELDKAKPRERDSFWTL